MTDTPGFESALNWLYGEASALLDRQSHPDAEAYAPLRAALQNASDLLGLKSPMSGDGSTGYEIALKRQRAAARSEFMRDK